MTRRGLLSSFLVLVLAVAAPLRAEGYFTEIEDLPVAPGMTEDPDASMVFASPAGRVVTVAASGTAVIADLRTYYRAALPELGWQVRSADSYVREGATLNFVYSRKDGRVTMQIRLASGSAEN